MVHNLRKTTIMMKQLGSMIDDLRLEPCGRVDASGTPEASCEGRGEAVEEAVGDLGGEEEERMLKLNWEVDAGAEGSRLDLEYSREPGSFEDVDDEIVKENISDDDDASSMNSEPNSVAWSEWSLDDYPLDPEMVQLVKDRNGAAGMCAACQELFASICAIGPDQEGGRMLDPSGNDVYNDGSSWMKGHKPTLLNFAHNTLPALTASARTGCGTCRTLLESLKVYHNSKYYEPVSEWFIGVSYLKHNRYHWRIALHARSMEASQERANGYGLDLIPTSGLQRGKSYCPDFIQ
jgi:hypothetical protein